MKIHEQNLAAQMLNEYSERLGNDGSNDWSWPPEWSVEQRVEFCREYHEFNGDPENFNPAFLRIPNYAVAAFLSSKLTPTPTANGGGK